MIRRVAFRLVQLTVTPGAVREGLMGDLSEIWSERRARDGRLRADLWLLREAAFTALRYSRLVQRVERRVWSSVASGPGGTRPPWPHAGLVRQAFRSLSRSPVLVATAVGALALAFGGSAALGTLAHHLLLRPLPLPHQDRLVVVEHEVPGYAAGEDVAAFGGHLGQVLHYGERARHLEAVVGWSTWDGVLAGDGAPPEPVRVAFVTPGLERVLGTPPLLGRSFEAEEPFPPSVPRGAAILSHHLWESRYGADPDIVGRVVERDGFEFEVVGVAPPRPGLSARPIDVWHPRPASSIEAAPAGGVQAMVARLAPGSTAYDARRELDRLMPELLERWPGTPVAASVRDGKMRARVTPLRAWLTADVRAPLLILTAAAAVVLLVALANVSGLLLVRAHARRDEMAVRLVLGAGQSGVLAWLAAEGLLLVLPAAVLGSAAGSLVRDALLRTAPVALPTTGVEPTGVSVTLAVAGLAVLAWVVLSAAPWLYLYGVSAKRRGGRPRSRTPDPGAVRARRILVGLQAGLTVVVLVGAATAYRQARVLAAVDPGFSDRNVLLFRVLFPFREVWEAGAAMDRASPFYLALRDRLAALPGVEGVGFGECVYMSRACEGRGLPVRPDGWDDQAEGELPVAAFLEVSEGFLEALGVPLLAGRPLEPADRRDRTQAVLVSRGAAERFWPGEDPLGKRLGQSTMVQGSDSVPPWRVVGVVGDVRLGSLGEAPWPAVYTAVHVRGQTSDRSQASFAVRTSIPPASLVPAVRRAVAALRGDVALTHVETTASLLADSTAPLRFSLALLMVASGVALLLGLSGVYGVVAYAVGLRRRELGIRIAVGAAPSKVRSMVLWQGTAAVMAGVVGGGAAAWLIGRSVAATTVLVVPVDAPICSAVAALTALAAVAAGWIPARRAAGRESASLLRDG